MIKSKEKSMLATVTATEDEHTEKPTQEISKIKKEDA
jgi:hypothetical protein